jgi:hypothetical protein
MEKRNQKQSNNYEYNEYHYNKNKIKPNINEINHEINQKNEKEILNNKFDAAYKKPKIINKLVPEKEEIVNDNEKKPDSDIDPIKERINKIKQENEKMRLSIEKRKKLISDLKSQCEEQKYLMAEMITKIDNIKKFIPDKTIKNKQNEKFEEQLAIAAVNEQIMKEICAGTDGHGAMNKIFEGGNKKSIMKNKIDHIPQVYYKVNKFDNVECSICFDLFKENELLKQLNCNHIFHKECLSQWLLNENKCPVCNKFC